MNYLTNRGFASEAVNRKFSAGNFENIRMVDDNRSIYKKIIISVGALIERKGHHFLIDKLRALFDRGTFRDSADRSLNN